MTFTESVIKQPYLVSQTNQASFRDESSQVSSKGYNYSYDYGNLFDYSSSDQYMQDVNKNYDMLQRFKLNFSNARNHIISKTKNFVRQSDRYTPNQMANAGAPSRLKILLKENEI